MYRAQSSHSRFGFTTVELLVVIGVVAVLAGLLFPSLIRARRAAQKSESMSNMRQINIWMNVYSNDNNDTVLPSQFDYSDDPFPGKVRSIPTPPSGSTYALSQGEEHRGTWADILWTINDLGMSPDSIVPRDGDPSDAFSYRYDSPDDEFYERGDPSLKNILRSATTNSRNTPNATVDPVTQEFEARPYGTGAREKGQPGYFAANDTFSCTNLGNGCAVGWVGAAQTRAPDRMMYLVDSIAGEIIQPDWNSYLTREIPLPAQGQNKVAISNDVLTNEVDFRYSNSCLMLLMDGHVATVSPWTNLNDLQQNHRINVTSPFNITPPIIPDS